VHLAGRRCGAGEKVADLSDVFVCADTGSVHVCDCSCDAPAYVNRRKNRVCTISGLETRGEVYTERRHKKKRKRRRRPWDDDEAASAVVRRLLFSDCRARLEKARYLQTRAKARSAAANASRARPLYATDLLRAYACVSCRAVYTLEFAECVGWDAPKRAAACRRYAAYARKAWTFLDGPNSLPHVQWEEFVVVALYVLRNGVHVGEECIVPQEFTLRRILPPTCHLDSFGFSKRSFTNIKNMVVRLMRERCGRPGGRAETSAVFEQILEGS
jgi:hypothetical protein